MLRALLRALLCGDCVLWRRRLLAQEAHNEKRVHKAQVRMQMQQRRLKSARLEMIECLREQQTIQVCLSER